MRKRLLSILLIPFICACGVKTVSVTESELLNHIRSVEHRNFMRTSEHEHTDTFDFAPFLPEQMNARTQENIHYLNLDWNPIIDIKDYSFNKKENWLCIRYNYNNNSNTRYHYYHVINGILVEESIHADGSCYNIYEISRNIDSIFGSYLHYYLSGLRLNLFFPTVDTVIGKKCFVEASKTREIYSAEYHGYMKTKYGCLVTSDSLDDSYSDDCAEFFINFDIGKHYVSNYEINFKYKDVEGITEKFESLEYDDSLHSKVVELFSNR